MAKAPNPMPLRMKPTHRRHGLSENMPAVNSTKPPTITANRDQIQGNCSTRERHKPSIVAKDFTFAIKLNIISTSLSHF